MPSADPASIAAASRRWYERNRAKKVAAVKEYKQAASAAARFVASYQARTQWANDEARRLDAAELRYIEAAQERRAERARQRTKARLAIVNVYDVEHEQRLSCFHRDSCIDRAARLDIERLICTGCDQYRMAKPVEVPLLRRAQDWMA